MTLDEILTSILKREGGYVDHPSDRGGPTNYGVTQSTLSSYRGKDVTPQDVKDLSENEARSIIVKLYWQNPGFDKLPGEQLQAIMLDCAVNHGQAQAVKYLQVAIGVDPDGVLGPVTLAALPYMDADRVARKVLAERFRHYGRIISHDHSQAVFASGWMNRAAELLDSVA